MSLSISLRRSPKPGAFTATTFRVPRILLTTSVASASPSMSSAMISSGLPAFAMASSTGSISFMFEIFFSLMRIRQSSRRGRHALGIGDEVRREVAAVELHALDDVERRLQGLVLLDGDDAFLADLAHGLGDDVADGAVRVGGDGADLRDLFLGLGGLGELLELGVDGLDGLVDAALERHRVVAGGDHLGAFAEDGARENGGGGGAVAGDVGSLGGDFLHHLRAHVLELVLELDFLGDGDAVLGDGGGAPALLEADVAAAWAEGDGDGVGEDVHAAQELVTGVLSEIYDLGHG